ncbi:MFS transporter [Streptomyces sp. NPDC002734]|uniref:MFS transporter n=1 Tax=Streptomyces sp. NPDC002734 TaxID=3154426 RepID=UPI00331EBC76
MPTGGGAGGGPLVEPTKRVGGGWTASLSLANGAVWVGWYGPMQILLASQTAAFAAGGDAAGAFGLAGMTKETMLAWVTGVGAVVALVASPVFGALSDRTASRWGRRRPWILAGSATGAVFLVLLGQAPGPWTMLVGWCLVQLTLNASFAAVTAAVPDRVPRPQRGTVGGWLGGVQIVGVVAGTGLAAAAGGIGAGYAACAVLSLLGVVPLLLHHEPPLPEAERPAPVTARRFLTGLGFDPRRHPDLGWAWLTRFLINLSNALVLLYLLYYLRDRVGHPDPEQGVLVLTVVNAVMLLATVVISGVRSDRSGRRKPYVLWSGVLMAGATLMLAGWQTWSSALVAAALLGVGFGVFTSVDFALMTEVLPDAAARGKDLGVINVANSLPQVMAPALAAPLVTGLGGYTTLYVVAGLLALAGALLVHRVRGVD